MADLHLVAAPPTGGGFSSSSPIRVVLAEDHALLRDALRLLLNAEEDVEVVTEACDFESARRHVSSESPHVLVLDLGMLGDAVHERIGMLRARAPGMQVVVLTMDESPLVAQHVIACGALGLVLKDRADGELVPAVRAVTDRKQYLSPRVAARLKAALRRSLTEE